MGLLRFLRTAALKSILASALTLEEEIYSLYDALKAECAAGKVPESILHIIDEEVGHQQLIRDMIAGKISATELEALLDGRELHIHHLQSLTPLSPQRHRRLVEHLTPILEREREVYNLFAGLYAKSKIPLARKAFRFLRDQEQMHVALLERLLRRSSAGS